MRNFCFTCEKLRFPLFAFRQERLQQLAERFMKKVSSNVSEWNCVFILSFNTRSDKNFSLQFISLFDVLKSINWESVNWNVTIKNSHVYNLNSIPYKALQFC